MSTPAAPAGPNRRTVLRGLALGGAVAAAGAVTAPEAVAAPGFIRSGRPQLPFGIQSGDVYGRSATVWSRADRPARMLVEVSRRGDFRDARVLRGPVVTPHTDLTGKVRLRGLPAGERIRYRVSFADLDDDSLRSAPVVGSFRTTPDRRDDVRFVWSADLAGQGWGIDPALGGFRIFDTMRRANPDFFLCSGDTVYADNPLPETVPLPDGRTWRNLVIPEKTKVAETLAEFRGQYRYNLLDDNLRRFAARVPQINQWDDHEVTNNWYPGEILTDAGGDARYTEKRVDVLAARARRAFFEWLPIAPQSGDEAGRIYRSFTYGPHVEVFVLDMRTYKDPNTPGLEKAPDGGVLGWRQLAWLLRGLTRSRATWKIVAADLPIGLIVPDGPVDVEAIANRDPGAPLGRELEIAHLLHTLHRRRVDNVVWLTADVHYTAAHRYDPARAAFSDFTPFWEFVSGPLHAGGFGPNALDATFGPEAVFVAAPPRANTSPAEGYQYFGQVDVDGRSGELTVRLRDLDGRTLFRKDLAPE